MVPRNLECLPQKLKLRPHHQIMQSLVQLERVSLRVRRVESPRKNHLNQVEVKGRVVFSLAPRVKLNPQRRNHHKRKIFVSFIPKVCVGGVRIVLIVMRMHPQTLQRRNQRQLPSQRQEWLLWLVLGAAASCPAPQVQDVFSVEWALDSGAGEHLASKEALTSQGVPLDLIEEFETISSSPLTFSTGGV